MEKAYKFRLYPNKAQKELIHKTIGCARFVYNQTLAARRDAYTAGSPLSGYDCVKLRLPECGNQGLIAPGVDMPQVRPPA